MSTLCAVDRHCAKRSAQSGWNAGTGVAYLEYDLIAALCELARQRDVIAARTRGVVEQNCKNLTDGHRIVKTDTLGRQTDTLELHMRMTQTPLLGKRFEPFADRLPVGRCRCTATQPRKRRRTERHLLFKQLQIGTVRREALIGSRGVAQFFGQHRNCRQRRADFVRDRGSLHAERDGAFIVKQALLRIPERCVT